MAKSSNGTVGLIVKIVAVILTFTGMVACSVWALGGIDKCVVSNTKAIEVISAEVEGIKEGIKEYIWPELIKNSDFRKTATVDTPYIRRDIAGIEQKVAGIEQRMAGIETGQQQILLEVRKQ